jgi:hypothetical protein
MFLVREVLHCAPGKVGTLIKKFRELAPVMEGMGVKPFRLLTDFSGEQFWTLVLEKEYASLDEIPAVESRVMSDPRARAAMGGYHDLVLKGRREIYKVEA